MLIQYGLNTHKRNGGLPRVVRSVFGTLLHPQTRNSSLGLPSKISTQELGRHNKKNSLAKLKHFLIFPMLGYYGRLLTGSPPVFYPFLATFVFICNSQKLVRAVVIFKNSWDHHKLSEGPTNKENFLLFFTRHSNIASLNGQY